MKKRVLSMLLAVFMIAGMITVSALTVSADEVGDFVIDENGVLTAYKGAGGNVVIPDDVTSIGDFAFQFCKVLRSVVIPDSVTSIGDHAFQGCYVLRSIVIPGSVTSIGDYAFDACEVLESVTIPEGVTSIGENTFFKCYALQSVTIPDSVTSIGNNAFCHCTSLQSIDIPDSVTSIAFSAFSGCTALTSVNIPAGVTSIEGNTFNGCYALQSVVIPDSVTSIGKEAFSDCGKLQSVVIPDSVTSIGKAAFSGCTSMTSLTFLGASVPSIGDDAFSGVGQASNRCKLNGPDIWNSLLSLENSWYGGYFELEPYTAKIGETLYKTLAGAITAAKSGDTITLLGDSNESFTLSVGVTFDANGMNYTGTVSAPDGYQVSTIGNIYTVDFVIDENGVLIRYNGKGGDVVIPKGVTSIAAQAFASCSKLQSVTIPDSVTSIGNKAFIYCGKLQSVVIPDSVKSIGDGAFFYCEALTSVNIPAGVTSINEGAFNGCKALESIVIPAGVTDIGRSAFNNCISLQSIVIPDSVKSIGGSAFYGCAAMTSFTFLGASVPSIESTEWSGTFSKIGQGNKCKLYVPNVWNGSLREDGFWYGGYFEFGETYSVTFAAKIGETGYKTLADAIAAAKDGDTVTLLIDSDESFTLPVGVTFDANGKNYTGKVSAPAKYKVNINGDVYTVEFVEFEIDENGVLTAYNGEGGNVTIPDDVTSIGENVFKGREDLESVVIPDSVTSIGKYAFSLCYNLKEVVIPAGVTSIDDWAFQNCSSLQSVVIPNGVTSIGQKAFQNCSSLTSINIPDSVTSIDGAFTGCASLTSINIPDSVTSIDGAFHSCSSLQSVVIPEKVTSIGRSTFEGCTALESVVIPENVTSIGQRAFWDCSSLQSIVIPEKVTSIDQRAFYRCTSMTSLTLLGASAPSIGNYAFTNVGQASNKCKLYVPNIWNGSLPDDGSWYGGYFEFGETYSVTFAAMIGDTLYETLAGAIAAAKDGDTVTLLINSNESFTLPVGVTFNANGKNYTGEVSAPTEYEVKTNGDVYTVEVAEFIIDENGVLTKYNGAGGDVVIPGGVTSIGENAFRLCTSLQSVVIPDGVTSIGKQAFQFCISLQSVDIPKSVTSIGESAFNNCGALESIDIPDGVTSIGQSAFCRTSLKSVVIPDSVTSIGQLAFSVCEALESIVIPDSVTSIGVRVFDGCKALQSVNIPKGVTGIAYGMFSLCSNLKEVVIPEGVTDIGGGAFNKCSSLQSVVIPEGVTSIGSNAFYGCTSMTSLTLLGASAPSIDSRAFTAVGQTDNKCKLYVPNVWNGSLESFENAGGHFEFGETYSVTYAAKIGETLYKIFADAIAAAKDGDTVTLLIDSDESFMLPVGVTFNANGKSYTGNVSAPAKYKVNIDEDVYTVEFVEFEIDENGVLTAYNGAGGDVVIPGGVTSIGENVFKGREDLESVVIPDSVTSIGKDAFSLCYNLKEVVIPERVTKIDTYAFYLCKSMTSLTFLSASAPSIGGFAFYSVGQADNRCKLYVPDSWKASLPDDGSWYGGYFEFGKTYVAKIGETLYETLADAIAEVGDGQTIEMIADVAAANGISVPSGKNFTVEFNGYSYSVEKPGAGSANTMTQAFQLLENSTITFQNGRIACTEANRTAVEEDGLKPVEMMIENYANLTLDSMEIDGTNINRMADKVRYIVSNNSGNVVIKDTNIITVENDIAFDTRKYGEYAVPTVELQGTSNVGAITLGGGNLTLTAGSVAALKDDGIGEGVITKTDDVTVEAPAGYLWKNNKLTAHSHSFIKYEPVYTGEGTSTQHQACCSDPDCTEQAAITNHVYEQSATGDYTCVQCGYVQPATDDYAVYGYGIHDAANIYYSSSTYTYNPEGIDSADYNFRASLVYNGVVELKTDATYTVEDDDTITTYAFQHWAAYDAEKKEEGQILSKSLSYKFIVKEAMHIIAVYDKVSEVAKGTNSVQIDSISATCSSKVRNSLDVQASFQTEVGSSASAFGFKFATSKQLTDAKINMANPTAIVDYIKSKGKDTHGMAKGENGFTASYSVGGNINDTVYILPYITVDSQDVYAEKAEGVRLADLAAPQISISQRSTSISGSTGYIQFTSTRSVPKCYEVVETGMLYAVNKDMKDKSGTLYSDSVKLNLIDAESWGADHVKAQIIAVNKKTAASNTALNGTYTLKINKGAVSSNRDKYFYGVAYVIVRDGSGKVTTLYSDPVAMTFNQYKCD